MAGNGLTVTATTEEVDEQPNELLTVTLNEPETAEVIFWAIEPLLQAYVKPFPLGALRVTEPPSQKVSGPFAVMLAEGVGITLTEVAAEVAEQPLLVTVTE